MDRVHVSDFEADFYVLTPQTRSLKHKAVQSINFDRDINVIMHQTMFHIDAKVFFFFPQ